MRTRKLTLPTARYGERPRTECTNLEKQMKAKFMVA